MTTLTKLTKKEPLCQICHKNKATINYANGWMEFTHGFTKKICKNCYDNITKNSEWYKRGFEDGKKATLTKKEKKLLKNVELASEKKFQELHKADIQKRFKESNAEKQFDKFIERRLSKK